MDARNQSDPPAQVGTGRNVSDAPEHPPSSSRAASSQHVSRRSLLASRFSVLVSRYGQEPIGSRNARTSRHRGVHRIDGTLHRWAGAGKGPGGVDFSAFAPTTLPSITSRARKITGFRRMGKRIVWELEDDLFMVFHLMVSGRFHWKKKGMAVPKRGGPRRVRLRERHADAHRAKHQEAGVALRPQGRGGIAGA